MMHITHSVQCKPSLPVGCFFCGKVIHKAAEKWTWMGATGLQVNLHTGCVYGCAAVLRFDAEDLAMRADTGGRFN